MGNRDTTMGKKPKWMGSVVTLAALWCLAQSAWAVEYRLQMTNLDYRTFAAYMGCATPWWGQNEPMERLEARLDALGFPPTAVLPGREVQLLQDPAYGGAIPPRVAVVPATRQQAWTTIRNPSRASRSWWAGATMPFTRRSGLCEDPVTTQPAHLQAGHGLERSERPEHRQGAGKSDAMSREASGATDAGEGSGIPSSVTGNVSFASKPSSPRPAPSLSRLYRWETRCTAGREERRRP